MKKILLVEDDPFIVDIYNTQLTKNGFKIDVSNSAEMALEKVKSNLPDLMILDINLPKMDGWDCLKMVRADSATKNIKVIVISNRNREDFIDNIKQLGVIEYFLKVETTPEEMTNAVKEILK